MAPVLDGDDPPLEVIVKTSIGETFSLHVRRNESIDEILLRVADQSRLEHPDQRIILNGKQLERENTLDHYNTPNASVLHSAPILRGGLAKSKSKTTENDSDEYEPDEEPPQKKVKLSARAAEKAKVPKTRAKKAATTPGPPVAAAATHQTAHQLPPLPEYTKKDNSLWFFKKLIDDGMKLKANAPLVYKPSSGRPRHVLDFPKIRDFKLVKPRQATVQRGGNVVKGRKNLGILARMDGGTATAVWNISATEIQPDGSEITLALFQSKHHSDRIVRNAIDFSVCPDLDSAERLGQQAVEILNRVPIPLDEDNWDMSESMRAKFNGAKLFIEVLALLRYQPQLDWNLIDDTMMRMDTAKGFWDGGYAPACGGSIEKRDKEKNFYSYRVPVSLEQKDDGSFSLSFRTSNYRVLSADPGMTFTPIPRGYRPFTHVGQTTQTFVNTQDANGSSECNSRALLASQHQRMRVIGHVATQDQMTRELLALSTELSGKKEEGKSSHGGTAGGSFNGKRIFLAPKLQNTQVIITMSTWAFEDLLVLPGLLKRDLSTKRGLGPITASRSRILHAYIRSEFVKAVAEGKGFLNGLYRSHLAAAQVDKGEIKPSQALLAICANPGGHPGEEHPCTHCPAIVPCTEMVVDVSGRLFCKGCATITDPANLVEHIAMKTSTYMTIGFHHMLRDGQYYSISDTMQKKLRETAQSYVQNDLEWKSALSGTWSLADAHYTAGPVRSKYSAMRVPHYNQPSYHKPYPMWVTERQTWLHHPKNLVLVTLAEQYLARNLLPGMVPYNALAAEKKRSGSTLLRPGEPEDRPFYQLFERAADNEFLISRTIYFVKSARVKQKNWTQKDFLNHLVPMMKSLVWNKDTTKFVQPNFPMLTRAGMRHYKREGLIEQGLRKEFKLWLVLDRARVTTNLQRIMDSDRFNPHQIQLAKSKDGAFWMWRADEMPDDYDLDFDFFEARSRLWTSDEECDEANEPGKTETPETYHYETLIQILRICGCCPLFGFRLSVRSGHAQVYSIGRALRRLDQNGNPTGADIMAGDAMHTGCTSPRPDNILEEYDFTRSTIFIMSLTANSVMSNFLFPGGDTGPLIDTICKISRTQNQWHDGIKSINSMPSVQIPGKLWRAQLAGTESLRLATEAALAEEDLINPEEVMDDFDDITKGDGAAEDGGDDDTGSGQAQGQNKGGSDNDGGKGDILVDWNKLSLIQDGKAFTVAAPVDDLVSSDSPAVGWFIKGRYTDGSRFVALPTTNQLFVTHTGIAVASWTIDGKVEAIEGDWTATMDSFTGPSTQEGAAPATKRVSQSTGAKLQRRTVSWLPENCTNPANKIHDTQVSVGFYPNDEIALSTEDGKYVTQAGVCVATWKTNAELDWDVYDLEQIHLGTIVEDPVA